MKPFDPDDAVFDVYTISYRKPHSTDDGIKGMIADVLDVNHISRSRLQERPNMAGEFC